MSRIGTWLRETAAAPRAMFANRDLRRLQLANVGSVLGNGAFLVALIVYAYDKGGATAVGLSLVVRVVPAALLGPVTSVLGDRIGRRPTMIAADVARAVLMAAAGAVIYADGPLWTVFAIVTASSIAGTAFRPAHQAILPGLARTPEELAAANVAASAITSVGSVVGPGLGGLVLAASSPGTVFLLNAASFVWSALLVVRVREPTEARSIRRARNPLGRDVAAGLGAIAGDRALLLLSGLYVAQAFVGGTLNVFVVLTAAELTGLGESGVGLLSAAIGVGGLVGAGVALALAVRRHLSTDFAVGLLVFAGALAAVGAAEAAVVVVALYALLGVGNTLVDVAASTLLQRAVPDEVLSRAFGALQSLLLAAMGLGALAAPALVAALDARLAIASVGAALATLTAASWPRLRAIDRAAAGPPPTELLRGVQFLAVLPEPVLERLASRAVVVRMPAGHVLVREGEPGDRFYVVEQGEVEIAGAMLGPGGSFGEIALLRDVPRTATATARTDVRLLALERDDFLAAVTAHDAAAAAAESVVTNRLGPLREGVAPGW